MALINFIAFVISNILQNLIFMQTSLFTKAADISQISKSVQRNMTFIFNPFLYAVDDFV